MLKLKAMQSLELQSLDFVWHHGGFGSRDCKKKQQQQQQQEARRGHDVVALFGNAACFFSALLTFVFSIRCTFIWDTRAKRDVGSFILKRKLDREIRRCVSLDQEALPFSSGWSNTLKPSSMPSALAVFTCRPNSHPFQERHVYLDEPVKIGRSVARCRPAQNNATFDCKVLSRNHALVWFDHKSGKVRHHTTSHHYSLYLCI